METFNWQLPIAILCVVWAGFVLVRRTIRLFNGRSGDCGTSGCDSCGSAESISHSNVTQQPFVSIDTLQSSASDGEKEAIS